MFWTRQEPPRPQPRKSPPIARPLPRYPARDHLRTTIRATFPAGSQIEYFIRPQWGGNPVEYEPQSSLLATARAHAGADFIRWAFGFSSGFTTDDPDLEFPLIGALSSDAEVLAKVGEDPFDLAVNQCHWEPMVRRDPRRGPRRIRDQFGFEESVRHSLHGALVAGLHQYTYHLTDSALYVFGESHERTAARLPLGLFAGASGNQQGGIALKFSDPGGFDFGELPENCERKQGSDGAETLVISAFQLQSTTRWDELVDDMKVAFRTSLPTCEFEVMHRGRPVTFSVTRFHANSFDAAVDSTVSTQEREEIRATDEFKRARDEAYGSLVAIDIEQLTRPQVPEPPDPPAVTSENSGAVDPLEARLARISRLFGEGLITQTEHDIQRKRILDEI